MRYLSPIWCLFILAFRPNQAGDDGHPEQLECYNDYLKEMICTWDLDWDTNCSTFYSLQYQLVNLSSKFTEVTDINTLSRSTCQCRIPVPSLVFPAKYDIKVLFKGIVVLSKYVEPSQTIKPLAPNNLNINTSKGKMLILTWEDDYTNSFIDKNLEYQVAYMKLGGNWKIINTANQKMLVLQALLDPGYVYRMKVRSVPIPSYGGMWSDWSAEYNWNYDSSELITPALIIIVCVFIPLPVVLCFFAFKLAKKSWWDKIPSPKESVLSKQIFNNSQNQVCVFSEKMFDDCKVEKVECTEEPPREERTERAGGQSGSVNISFLSPQHLLEVSGSNGKFAFPQFPGFGFPVLTDSLSPFPLPFDDLSLGPSGGPGYSLFNSVAKDRWASEEEGYQPFTPDSDGDSPPTLRTYSLSPGAGSQENAPCEPSTYRPFSGCVSAPGAKVVESRGEPGAPHSSGPMQPHLWSSDTESVHYLPSDKLTFTPSSEAMPDWQLSEAPHAFTLGAGTDLTMDPFPMFPESLQSWNFPLSAEEEPESWQPPSTLGSQLLPSQHCCPELELGTPANTLSQSPLKYIVIPEDGKADLGQLTPYMKLSLLNMQATDKRRGAETIHPRSKQIHLKC